MATDPKEAGLQRGLLILTAVLEKEIELHRSMVLAAGVKREAIISGDLPGLETILVREKELVAAIEEEENKRLAVQPLVRRGLGLGQDPGKLDDVINCLEGEAKAKLTKVRDELREVLNECRKRTRHNAELLKASLAHVDAFLKTVADATCPDANYGKNGRRVGGGQARLDRSA